MQISWSSSSLHDLVSDALIIPLTIGQKIATTNPQFGYLDDLIEHVNRHQDWKGDVGEVAVYYIDDRADNPLPHTKRILLVGMGKAQDWTYEKMRLAISHAFLSIKGKPIQTVSVFLPENINYSTVKDITEIILLTDYSFRDYKKNNDESKKELVVSLSNGREGLVEMFAPAISEGMIIGTAVNETRRLGNQPPNVLTTNAFAEYVQKMQRDDLSVRIMNKQELASLGFGALLAAAQGSVHEPYLAVLEYRGGEQKSAPVCLVGKGVTFDAGGISLKPSEAMNEMKMDMAGAATCLGVIDAAARLTLPINLVVIVPIIENMPSGSAARPSDIVKSFNGTTIEIMNTDAEGRLILVDAIAYAIKHFSPSVIIDCATLTGAVLIALGHEAAAILGNNDELMQKIQKASDRTGERVWPFPLWDEYKEQIKSDVADIKNLGDGRKAGVMAGAAFIAHFVPNEIPWVHLDVAGTAIMDKPRRPYWSKGASGWGVRLLVNYLEEVAKSNS